ncbi:MAG: glycine zipper family protein [Candidatus Binataceae bacterium]
MKNVRMPFFVRREFFGGVVALFVLLGVDAASAQNNDMFIYPAKGQSQAQQDKDRYECHSWAVRQTGFDPSIPQTANAQPAQPYQPSKPHALQGAGRGAALGAVGGAITGNAGKGAAAGAAMGGLAGGFRRRDERLRQADAQADRAVAGNPARPAYMRAMSACLQGRGYTVN